eukprot:2309995-Rhodomonas_salina.1
MRSSDGCKVDATMVMRGVGEVGFVRCQVGGTVIIELEQEICGQDASGILSLSLSARGRRGWETRPVNWMGLWSRRSGSGIVFKLCVHLHSQHIHIPQHRSPITDH